MAGLVDALVAVVGDAGLHHRLTEGAARLAGEFSFDVHLELLQHVFDEVVH